MDLSGIHYIVVGAGFFGSVIAERIAQDMGERVVVIEKRNHLGGNSYSEIDNETGIEIHVYGSHIFHTINQKVWNYINNFTEFNHYHHRVYSSYKDRIYGMPINLSTINSFYNTTLQPEEAIRFIENECANEKVANPNNFEEKALSTMGRPLYEAFVSEYTQKQWGMEPRLLPAFILNRIPLRFNYDSAYFQNQNQGIPLSGYSGIFKKLLSNKNIDVFLDTDFFTIKHLIPDSAVVIFSGPIDSYFNYKHGILGWRTLTFEKEIHNVNDFQGTTVVNFPEKRLPFTRIHEFKHYHPERNYSLKKTVIFKEYSHLSLQGHQPFYPINTEKDKHVFDMYKEESRHFPNVNFCGRLGSYKYLNMDETILQALELYEKNIKNRCIKKI